MVGGRGRLGDVCLDLDSDSSRWDGGFSLEKHMSHLTTSLDAADLQADICRDVTKRVQVWSDTRVCTADVVEILAITKGLRQVELVQACSSAQYELAAEEVIPSDFDHEPR